MENLAIEQCQECGECILNETGGICPVTKCAKGLLNGPCGGAEFFQTQAVYDPKRFETFVRKTEAFGVPIQYGIVIVKSPRMGKFMNAKVSGIRVPAWIIDEMGSVAEEKRRQKAAEITARLVAEIAPMAQGVHFMPLGWSDVVVQVIEEIQEKGRNFARASGA